MSLAVAGIPILVTIYLSLERGTHPPGMAFESAMSGVRKRCLLASPFLIDQPSAACAGTGREKSDHLSLDGTDINLITDEIEHVQVHFTV